MEQIKKIDLDKLNFLDIAKSELKAAGYVIAAGQVIKRVNKVIKSTAEKTKNESVNNFVKSTTGNATINYALAMMAKKLPKIGDSNPIKYISTGLRVGALANLGNAVVDKVFSKKEKKEEPSSQ